MKALDIKPWMTIQEVIDGVPGAAERLCRLGMACVGCTMARFDTVAEVARSYDEDPDALILVLSGSVTAMQKEKQDEAGT